MSEPLVVVLLGGRTTPRTLTETGAHHAFLLLRGGFALAPVLFGLDKFAGVMVDWERYLAPWVDGLVPGTASPAMMAVGVVEVAAGILVALRPRIGGYVVAAWVLGIIVNRLSMGEYYDIALRDFGLLLAALALARLAASTAGRRPEG